MVGFRVGFRVGLRVGFRVGLRVGFGAVGGGAAFDVDIVKLCTRFFQSSLALDGEEKTSSLFEPSIT